MTELNFLYFLCASYLSVGSLGHGDARARESKEAVSAVWGRNVSSSAAGPNQEHGK